MLSNSKKLMIVRASVIAIVILAGSFTSVSAQDEEITPDITVKTFYKWYLKWTNEKQNPTKNKEATNYYLSARFSQWYYSKEGQNVYCVCRNLAEIS